MWFNEVITASQKFAESTNSHKIKLKFQKTRVWGYCPIYQVFEMSFLALRDKQTAIQKSFCIESFELSKKCISQEFKTSLKLRPLSSVRASFQSNACQIHKVVALIYN